MNRLRAATCLTVMVVVATTQLAPAVAGPGQHRGDPGPVIEVDHRTIVVRHTTEHLWFGVDVPDQYWSNDYYEWCAVTLQSAATSRPIATAQVDASDLFAGWFEIHDDDVTRAGRYNVVADCYFSGQASIGVNIKWGTRARIARVTRDARSRTVNGRVWRWSAERGGGWAPLRGTRVLVERWQRDRWVTVTTAVSTAAGVVVAARIRGAGPLRLRIPGRRGTAGAVAGQAGRARSRPRPPVAAGSSPARARMPGPHATSAVRGCHDSIDVSHAWRKQTNAPLLAPVAPPRGQQRAGHH